MPDIGLFELILIGGIAFLVLGPERMPEFLGQIGRMVRRGRMWITSIKQQLDEETREVRDSGREVRDSIEGISTLPEEKGHADDAPESGNDSRP